MPKIIKPSSLNLRKRRAEPEYFQVLHSGTCIVEQGTLYEISNKIYLAANLTSTDEESVETEIDGKDDLLLVITKKINDQPMMIKSSLIGKLGKDDLFISLVINHLDGVSIVHYTVSLDKILSKGTV